MPVMDGFHLIARAAERYPHIPILVMTSMEEAEHRNLPLSLGALRIFPKPVRLSTLMDEIRAAAVREPEGFVRGIGLNSLLQLMEWERKDATLVVTAEPGVGLLYVKEGQLVHAAQGEAEGFEAAYRILNWPKPSIAFVDTCRVERTMDLPLTEVLLNAAMVQDLGRPDAPPPAPDAWGGGF